jgi:hypothetical protein
MSTEFIVWVIIQVIIVYLCIVLIVAAQVCITDDVPSLMKLSDPLDIRTGDILGIGYNNNPFAWFVTAWSSSVWTHTGLAWRDPDTNELYVFEAAHYGGKYTGVFRIPYGTWLRINRRHKICHLRYRGNAFDSIEGVRKMSSIFKTFELIKLDSLNWTWYRLLMKRPYREESLQRHYVCYEITILLLQRLGIVRKQFTCSSYLPRDVIWRHLHMEPGHIYDNPVMVSPQRIPV